MMDAVYILQGYLRKCKIIQQNDATKQENQHFAEMCWSMLDSEHGPSRFRAKNMRMTNQIEIWYHTQNYDIGWDG